jgi:hypothetical protein
VKHIGNLFDRIVKTAMGLPKPLSEAHLERLARDKRWADLAEEADKRSARARDGLANQP